MPMNCPSPRQKLYSVLSCRPIGLRGTQSHDEYDYFGRGAVITKLGDKFNVGQNEQAELLKEVPTTNKILYRIDLEML